MDVAQSTVEKYRKGEKLNGVDLKAIIRCVLPLSGFSDKPSYYETKCRIDERLAQLPQHWSTYFGVDLNNGLASLRMNIDNDADEVELDVLV